MPRHARKPPIPSKPRQPRVHQARVGRAQDFRAQTQAFQHAWPVRVDEHVGLAGEGEEEGAAARVGEVDGEGGFVAREEVGCGLGGGLGGGGGVLGAVDAQDGGACVGEYETGEGAW